MKKDWLVEVLGIGGVAVIVVIFVLALAFGVRAMMVTGGGVSVYVSEAAYPAPEIVRDQVGEIVYYRFSLTNFRDSSLRVANIDIYEYEGLEPVKIFLADGDFRPHLSLEEQESDLKPPRDFEIRGGESVEVVVAARVLESSVAPPNFLAVRWRLLWFGVTSYVETGMQGDAYGNAGRPSGST